MKKLLFICVSTFSFLWAEDTTPDIASVSNAFGHIIYKNFTYLNVDFDIEQIVEGIREASSGKESPLTEKQCVDAIYSEQEKGLKILSSENLQKAETFLANNVKEDGVVSLEKGRVQYRVIATGKGEKIKPHSNPLLRFTVKTLDDKKLWDQLEERISIDESLSALSKALVGMKEGEKRIFYIHPELSFQNKELHFLIPNELLSFEIEVLKAS